MGNRTTVAVLGTTGMLGSMVAKVLKKNFEVIEINRGQNNINVDADWVVNCIGIIKPKITTTEEAIRVNALFPHELAKADAKIIQIATDCVYSGKKGHYIETDPHTATDVYGMTKSLGEADVYNLRCSIIGPEVKNHVSLLDWFLQQKEAKGFINHWWNGVTTYHFAKICEGIIREDIKLPKLQHIVPADMVTKAALLELIAKAYKLKIPIDKTKAPERIDRTLSTNNPELNKRLWKAAGYSKPPTIEHMIKELYESTHKSRN